MSLIRSIRHAARGLGVVFKQENNFRIQVVFSVAVIVFTVFVQTRLWELILVILLCASIMILEVFNSVIERMADGLSPRLQPYIRDIKDLMAGAVLLLTVVAVVVGLLILWPYFMDLFRA